MKLLVITIVLSGCASTDITVQAKQKQIAALRQQCMNNVTNDPTPNPILRTQILHQCNAWANSKVN